jgi:predicted ATPase
VVIEDAQWADRSTRDFLSFLIRNARHGRLVVAVTYRTDELHRRHPLRSFLAEADRAPAVTRLALERFTRTELIEQLTGILGHRRAPRLVYSAIAPAPGGVTSRPARGMACRTSITLGVCSGRRS